VEQPFSIFVKNEYKRMSQNHNALDPPGFLEGPRYLEVVGSGVLDLDAVGSDVLDLDAVGSGVLDLDALDLDAVDPGEQLEDLNLNQKLRN
jgi:hypothetical protein